MRKFMLYYLTAALPAILLALFFQNRSTISVILQWIFAILMIAAWSVITALSTIRHGRRALGLLLLYMAFALFDITMIYTVAGPSPVLHFIFYTMLGLFTFRPLDILAVALLGYNIPQEMIVVGILCACCLIGFLVGIAIRASRKRKRFA